MVTRNTCMAWLPLGLVGPVVMALGISDGLCTAATQPLLTSNACPVESHADVPVPSDWWTASSDFEEADYLEPYYYKYGYGYEYDYIAPENRYGSKEAFEADTTVSDKAIISDVMAADETTDGTTTQSDATDVPSWYDDGDSEQAWEDGVYTSQGVTRQPETEQQEETDASVFTYSEDYSHDEHAYRDTPGDDGYDGDEYGYDGDEYGYYYDEEYRYDEEYGDEPFYNEEYGHEPYSYTEDASSDNAPESSLEQGEPFALPYRYDEWEHSYDEPFDFTSIETGHEGECFADTSYDETSYDETGYTGECYQDAYEEGHVDSHGWSDAPRTETANEPGDDQAEFRGDDFDYEDEFGYDSAGSDDYSDYDNHDYFDYEYVEEMLGEKTRESAETSDSDPADEIDLVEKFEKFPEWVSDDDADFPRGLELFAWHPSELLTSTDQEILRTLEILAEEPSGVRRATFNDYLASLGRETVDFSAQFESTSGVEVLGLADDLAGAAAFLASFRLVEQGELARGEAIDLLQRSLECLSSEWIEGVYEITVDSWDDETGATPVDNPGADDTSNVERPLVDVAASAAARSFGTVRGFFVSTAARLGAIEWVMSLPTDLAKQVANLQTEGSAR